MDLDLSTNGTSIKENILKLNSGKISWLILGYSENCTLNVIETGDNSLEDMFDEFQGSEIMYGFASVIDPNTKLKKNIYIHWQGAGSKQVMKTKSVQHSNVIRELCKPIHVTINARDSQDLELKEVMQKVASASGANYSFHTEKQQIFETKPVIKSQSISANAAREERQRELASIGVMKKEISTNQKVNSSQNKIKPDMKPPLNITQNYSKDTSYKKINPEKEFKSLPQNQKSTFETPARIQSENNTAEKAREERQKELSKLVNRTYVDEPFQQVGTNYTKINPLADIQQLKRQGSVNSEESKSPSEFSKLTKNSFVEEPIHQVGTNYTKINPLVEIQQLRRQSSATDSEIPKNTTTSSYIKCTPREEIIKLRKESVTDDDGTQVLFNSYKKIDPLSEIQQLRKSHKFDIEENAPPSSVYKKINPIEEMKNLKLRSDSNSSEPSSPGSNYKKVNPAEEIMSAKTSSESFRNAGVTSSSNKMVPTEEIIPVRNYPNPSTNSEKKSFQQLNSAGEQKSARSSFEQLHKGKQDTHKSSVIDHNSPQTTTGGFKKTLKMETETSDEKVESNNNILNHEFDNQPVSPKKVENSKESKSAVAIYDYEAIDSDEIGFLMDDIITNIEIIDEGWWIGCTKNGRKGMFPSNYVQMITTDKEPDIEKHNDNTTMNPIENKITDSLTVVAIYDYQSLQDDEISFKEGDYIYNVDQFDEGWWSGENKDGAKGMFPSNYVKFL